MSAPWTPASRLYHLRIFGVCLVLIAASLVAFLVGAKMEATAKGTGLILAREQFEIRAPLSGLIELGWYEGVRMLPNRQGEWVRLDRMGDGHALTGNGKIDAVHRYRIIGTEASIRPEDCHFHRLRTGDELWPGQVIGEIRQEEPRLQLSLIEERLQALEAKADPGGTLNPHRNGRERRQSLLYAPETSPLLLTLEVRVATAQAVAAGDSIASFVPIDPATHEPSNLLAQIEIEERYHGDVAVGQTVRYYSTMYNHRLYGVAEGVIERLEPWGVAGPNGERRFYAWGSLGAAPFPMRLGSSFRAEVVVGRKPVYRLILEQ